MESWTRVGHPNKAKTLSMFVDLVPKGKLTKVSVNQPHGWLDDGGVSA